MKSVLLVLPSLRVGGAERVLVDLANELAKRGRLVQIVVLCHDGPLRARVDESVDVTVFGRSRVALALPSLIRVLLRSRDAAVMSAMTHTNVVLLLAHIIAGSHRRRIVVQEVALVAGRSKLDTRMRRSIANRLARSLYRYADHVVAVSSGVRDDLVAAGMVDRVDMSVIPNPVNLKSLRHHSDDEINHPWMDPDERRHKPLLIGVGRLEPEKRFDVLVNAIAHLHHSGGMHRLILVGEGSDETTVRQAIETNQLGAHVDLVGVRTNPWHYMANADVLVVSSRWEGFGLVLVEAMACGTQVVSTRCGASVIDILDGGRLGELANVNDPVDLANAIKRALAGRRKPGVLQQAVERFDIGLIADAYEAILDGDRASGVVPTA